MAKGTAIKPDVILSGQTFQVKLPQAATSDTLSSVDKGSDFVKQGETAQVGH